MTTEERIAQKELEDNPEYQALKDGMEGYDLKEMVTDEGGGTEDPPPDTPKPGDPGYVAPSPDTPKPGDPGYVAPSPDALKPGDLGYVAPQPDTLKPGDPGYVEPKKETPAAGTSPPENTFTLKEIFGERFKTAEELKAANISGQLEELGTLKQENQSLKEQLENPVIGFADDSLALFNEFVKETGIKDYRVFSQIVNSDPEKLDHMEAIVLSEVMKNPKFSGREDLLRKSLEKRFKVDPKLLEDGDLDESEMESNKILLETEAAGAMKSIKEIKEKLKLPEKREISTPGRKPLTPEQATEFKEVWQKVTVAIGKEWKSVPLTPDGAKGPLLSYVIPEADKQLLVQEALQFVTENQMEPNPANVKQAFNMMQQNFLNRNLPKVVQAIAEKVKGLTKEEYDAIYEYPSSINTDVAPKGGDEGELDQIDEIFKKEMKELGG